MKVSVIIPIYNAEKYLEQCIESVINQTLKDIEIVLIDDGSTDGSAEICKKYLAQDKRITYYYKENEGLAAARQDGIERSYGEYIGFVDSDDWIEPDMYEKMYSAAKSCDADVLLCNAFLNEEKKTIRYGIQEGSYFYGAISDTVLPKSVITIDLKGQRSNIRWSNCIRVYKRQMVIDNHLSFGRHFRRCQDYPFTLDCMLHARSFYYLNDYLYHNRQDANSLSRGYTKDMWNLIRPLIQYVNNAIDSRKDIDWKKYNEASAFFLCLDCILNEFKPDAPSFFKKMKHIKEIINDRVCQNSLNRFDATKLNKINYNVFYRNMKYKRAWRIVHDYNYNKGWVKNKVVGPFLNFATETKLYKRIRKR